MNIIVDSVRGFEVSNHPSYSIWGTGHHTLCTSEVTTLNTVLTGSVCEHPYGLQLLFRPL